MGNLINFSRLSGCDWCPDYGPFCNSPGWSCCGCADSWCWSCRSISSCATWVPNGGWECPDSSNGNSTRWGSCYWVRNIDMKSNWSVLRCNSVDRNASVKIKWDVTYKPGTFYVSIFDKANFFNFRENKPYTCLNKNCGNNGPSPHQYGSMVASGSTDYYVITMGFTAGNYQIVASVE